MVYDIHYINRNAQTRTGYCQSGSQPPPYWDGAATGAPMTKGRVWTVPITKTVIKAVESLAESQGYKSLKLLGKNKTRLLPSDWDEDEEYIFDDSYDSDDDDDDDNDDDNVEEFEDVDENELDDLRKENESKEADDAQQEQEDNNNQAGVPKPDNINNNEQPGVPEVEDVDEEVDAEEDYPDDATETTDETSRTSRNRQPVERLTYDRLGATHQQQDGTRQVSFNSNKLEMCHNIMTDDDTYKRVEYSADKADIIARIMVQIHEGVTEQGFGFVYNILRIETQMVMQA